MNLLIYQHFLASRRLRSSPNIKIQRPGTEILAWSLMLLPAADLGVGQTIWKEHAERDV